MFKSLSLILLASLSAPTLISATSDWSSQQGQYSAPAPPAPPAEKPYYGSSAPPPVRSVHIVFQGANPPVAQYERDVPVDGSQYYTHDVLSISHVITDAYVDCVFYGIDNLVLPKSGPGLIDVGPPQTITSVSCSAPHGYKAKRFEA